MKKILALLLFALAASFGRADTKTNYVYVVSNIYNQVFTENVVTQKVKNTHTNYYITNNVTTVNKIYNTTFKTNLSINCDLSDTYVRAASNQANRASGYVTNACGFADNAAESATAAASSASSASSSASSAAYQRTQAANECASALTTINARINWFDEHAGQTITNVNFITNITMDTIGQMYDKSRKAYELVIERLYNTGSGYVRIQTKMNIDPQSYYVVNEGALNEWYVFYNQATGFNTNKATVLNHGFSNIGGVALKGFNAQYHAGQLTVSSFAWGSLSDFGDPYSNSSESQGYSTAYLTSDRVYDHNTLPTNFTSAVTSWRNSYAIVDTYDFLTDKLNSMSNWVNSTFKKQ